jgi:hypothetical protein
MESHLRAEMVLGVPNHATIKILIRTNRLKFLPGREIVLESVSALHGWQLRINKKGQGNDSLP